MARLVRLIDVSSIIPKIKLEKIVMIHNGKFIFKAADFSYHVM